MSSRVFVGDSSGTRQRHALLKLLLLANMHGKTKTPLPASCLKHALQMRVYLLSAGFSLAFGSMFAKTYRINKIFTYSNVTVVKDKLLRDKQLITLILTLLLIDAIIISLWVVIDPMKRYLYNLPLDVSSRSRGVVYQPQVRYISTHILFRPYWHDNQYYQEETALT